MTDKKKDETKKTDGTGEDAAAPASEDTAAPAAEPEPASETTSADDPVAAKLKEHGVDDATIDRIKSELADSEEELSYLSVEDFKSVGIKPGKAKMLVEALKSTAAPAAPVEPVVSQAGAMGAVSFDAVLPTVPTDSSWLEALRTGGVLKVDQSTVISAIRAALAYRAGLYGIPAKLVELMEAFADQNEEQVDPEFFKLRKQMTRRSYAEIFEAIDGLDGSYVTEVRKKQLFGRIDQYLWPAIAEFHQQLKSWQEAWMQGAANPAMMMASVMAAIGGTGGMPPGLMQPPETGILRDTADAVADAVNRVFAGTGVQISAALAYDATKIKETLENPRLPSLIGAANRDQMLRQLKVAVSATYPRMENNLTRFVLATMQVKDQPSGNEELQYFGSLFMLGSQIPWDQLDGGGASSIRQSPSPLGDGFPGSHHER